MIQVRIPSGMKHSFTRGSEGRRSPMEAMFISIQLRKMQAAGSINQPSRGDRVVNPSH